MKELLYPLIYIYIFIINFIIFMCIYTTGYFCYSYYKLLKSLNISLNKRIDHVL